MRKLNLIIENIKDEYMINLLEEGTASELESLKTKKFLNESLGRVRGMLIEEGVMDSVKNHLGNNWGKYLAAAGAAGLGAHGASVLGADGESFDGLGRGIGRELMSGDPHRFGTGVGMATGAAGDLIGTGAADLVDKAGNAIGGAYDSVKEFGHNLLNPDEAQAKADFYTKMAQGNSGQEIYNNLAGPVNDALNQAAAVAPATAAVAAPEAAPAAVAADTPAAVNNGNGFYGTHGTDVIPETPVAPAAVNNGNGFYGTHGTDAAPAAADKSWYGAQSETAPQDTNAVYGKKPRWLK